MQLFLLNYFCSIAIFTSSPLLAPKIDPPQITTQTAFHDCVEQNKPVILLYYANYCPYSQKVLGYLRQIHKTIPMKDVEGNTEEKKELLRIGGKLQVPCLIVDGKVIYDSNAIIEWLSQHKDLLDPAA
jgi:glutaredoxin 3